MFLLSWVLHYAYPMCRRLNHPHGPAAQAASDRFDPWSVGYVRKTMNELDDSTASVSEVHLSPTQSAPGDARRFVADVLAGHEAVESAKLIISELVTNAVLHGGRDAGRVTVVVGRDEQHDRIHLEVSQAKHSGFHYLDRELGHLGPTGRGLMIVDAIAAEWGIDDETGSVWVVLA